MNEKLARLEAALFLSPEPVSVDTLSHILGVGSKGYVRSLAEQLEEELAQEHRGLTIREVNGKYELTVKRELVEEVAHLAPHQDMSTGTLRTLSLVAYEHPIPQKRVIDIRGNRAYEHVKELERRGFVTSQKKGNSKQLHVTDEFLRYFGLDTAEEFKMHVDNNITEE